MGCSVNSATRSLYRHSELNADSLPVDVIRYARFSVPSGHTGRDFREERHTLYRDMLELHAEEKVLTDAIPGAVACRESRKRRAVRTWALGAVLTAAASSPMLAECVVPTMEKDFGPLPNVIVLTPDNTMAHEDIRTLAHAIKTWNAVCQGQLPAMMVGYVQFPPWEHWLVGFDHRPGKRESRGNTTVIGDKETRKITRRAVTLNPDNTDQLTVMLHELGHVLRLAHAPDKTCGRSLMRRGRSIMNPRSPTPDDCRAVRRMMED